MISLHPSDIRATLWPKRLVQVRSTLNRSSRIIILLGLTALSTNAVAVWLDRNLLPPFDLLEISTWFHPAYINSLIIAVIIVYAMRQISRTRQKLTPLGYPLLEKVEQHRGLEIWKSVEPLTKRPAILHIIRQEKYPNDRSEWKTISHRWVKRGEKARRLTSPHAARVLDCGFAQGDGFYLVMELPRGISLAELIRRYGPCPLDRAIFLLAQIAHALQDAHANDLDYLTLNPEHIFIGHRSSNMDWVTVTFSGYESEDEPIDAMQHDVQQFAMLAVGIVTGDRVSQDFSDSVSRSSMPYSIKDILLRCLASGDEHAHPPIQEIVRRMALALPGPTWNNDRAAAWWKQQEINEAAPAGDAP